MEGSLFLSVAASMEAKQTLDQIDDTADSVVEIICDVQLKMSMLHTTVGDLMNSMAVTLNSMADMKDSLFFPQPATESVAMVDQIQELPVSPKKQSSTVLENDKAIDENEKKSRYIELKKIQVEIPVFVGDNVNMWIMKAERYFEMGNFSETEKVELAYLSMDGQALNWFNLWKNREAFIDWNDFKSRLLKRFGGLKSAFERLLNLKQEESVIDYLNQFEELAWQIEDISEESLKECLYVNGLREEIQDMISLFQPKGLDSIIAMARRLENSPFCRVPDVSSQSTDDAAINKQVED